MSILGTFSKRRPVISPSAFSVQIIRKLMEERAPLHAEIKDVELHQLSLILDADNETGRMTLDQFPKEGHEHLSVGDHIKAHMSDCGISVVFNTEILEINNSKEDPHYITSLPPKIHYFQRRNAFRIDILNAGKHYFYWMHDDKAYNSCHIMDISFTGLQFFVPDINLTESIGVEDIIEDCRFRAFVEESTEELDFGCDIDPESSEAVDMSPHQFKEKDTSNLAEYDNMIESAKDEEDSHSSRFPLYILDDDDPYIINCDFHIRRIYFDENKKGTIISGEYMNVEKPKQILLNNFVCQIERIEIKNKIDKYLD